MDESAAARPFAEADRGAAKAAPGLMSRRAGGLKRAITLDLGAIREPAAKSAADSGETMGEYSSLEVLGRGAFGSVYKACQEKTGRLVALKTFHVHDGDGVARSARSEYQMLRQLSHPHIVKAFDFLVHDGAKEVVVMELFAGATISRAVRKAAGRGLAEADSRALFGALLDALGYMHRNGYVHRDVKPENVLVSEDLKDLLLVDFNLACKSSEITSLSCAGTEFYAAPEVLAGEAPTERNDVWGAGVCLHLMLCGRVPDLCGAPGPCGAPGGPREVPLAGTRWAKVSDGAKSATRQCLALDADLRPTASAMLEHPWVSNGEAPQASASSRLRTRYASN